MSFCLKQDQYTCTVPERHLYHTFLRVVRKGKSTASPANFDLFSFTDDDPCHIPFMSDLHLFFAANYADFFLLCFSLFFFKIQLRRVLSCLLLFLAITFIFRLSEPDYPALPYGTSSLQNATQCQILTAVCLHVPWRVAPNKHLAPCSRYTNHLLESYIQEFGQCAAG